MQAVTHTGLAIHDRHDVLYLPRARRPLLLPAAVVQLYGAAFPIPPPDNARPATCNHTPAAFPRAPQETGIAAALSALGPGTKQTEEAEMYDIYLLPPNEDPETCQTWLRMRNKEGRYSLMFEEWVSDGPFTISPRITFEVRGSG